MLVLSRKNKAHMLNCIACGHDNLPITNEQTPGWVNGNSVQVVKHCHNCGARITEECDVCGNLHPLNTKNCSLHGVNIADFVSHRINAEERLSLFVLSRDVKEIVRVYRRLKRFGRSVYLTLGLLMLSILFPETLLTMFLFFSGAMSFLCGMLFEMYCEHVPDNLVHELWRSKNTEHITIRGTMRKEPFFWCGA